jgi:hypothetical protein
MDGVELRFLIAVEEGEGEGRFAALPLPDGPCWLGAPGGAAERPALEAGDPPPHREALRLEPVLVGRRLRLLASGASALDLRVNGLRPPPLTVLSPRDEIRLAGGAVLHLALFRQPRVEKPGEERAGGLCPVCRTPIVADRPAYFCGCGQLLHLDGEDQPAGERLECARAVNACPDCGLEVRWSAGYEGLPEAER